MSVVDDIATDRRCFFHRCYDKRKVGKAGRKGALTRAIGRYMSVTHAQMTAYSCSGEIVTTSGSSLAPPTHDTSAHPRVEI
jgi:hypothetical protein